MKDLPQFDRHKLIEFNNYLIKKYKEAGFNHSKYLAELSGLENSSMSDKEYLDELEFFYDKLISFIRTNKIKNVKVDVFNKLKFSAFALPVVEVNLTKLKAECEAYVQYCMSEDYNDDRAEDYEHFIFEEALKAFYGKDIFQKISLAKA